MNELVQQEQVRDVRAFNRFYTSVMGFLDQGLLQSRFTLTEARVLFELSRADRIEVSDLRERMKIDPGHLSRILSRFESAGLVVRTRSEQDGRRQCAELTHTGTDAFTTLNARSDEQALRLLTTLDEPDRHRLLEALHRVEVLLGREAEPKPAPPVVIRAPRAGELGWVIHRHGVLYDREYRWDQSFEALVANIVAQFANEHDPARERAWIAEVNGQPVGSVFCVRKDDRTAQLRLLLVEPAARGLGVGGALVDQCVSFARSAHYDELTLWTNDVLSAARRIYQRAGFRLVEEEGHRSFGHDLIGQYWSLALS